MKKKRMRIERCKFNPNEKPKWLNKNDKLFMSVKPRKVLRLTLSFTLNVLLENEIVFV